MKFIFLLFTCFFASAVYAQNRFHKWINPVIDSAYVESYNKDLILRVYSSHKYSNQRIIDFEEKTSLSYLPSGGSTLGVGFTHKFITLNLGFVFPFTRLDEKKYGKTDRLDLQVHLYLKRFYVDCFSGYYKGQYLSNTQEVMSSFKSENGYYTRNDLKTYSVGLGIYTNFNPQKFRYEAPFLQNVRQKKSAGSPTAGLEVFWVGSQADSSLIPKGIVNTNFFGKTDFNKWEILTFNLSGGYAYNFVILKKFFILLSLNGSLGLGYNHIYPINSGKLNHLSINTGINQRIGIGYQFDRIFVGASWIGYHLLSPTAIPKTYIDWIPGVMRFNIAYRLSIKKRK